MIWHVITSLINLVDFDPGRGISRSQPWSQTQQSQQCQCSASRLLASPGLTLLMFSLSSWYYILHRVTICWHILHIWHLTQPTITWDQSEMSWSSSLLAVDSLSVTRSAMEPQEQCGKCGGVFFGQARMVNDCYFCFLLVIILNRWQLTISDPQYWVWSVWTIDHKGG